MRRMCLSLFLFCSADTFALATTVPVHFGLFGQVHTAVPPAEVKRAVVLVSDRNGWDARAESLAVALAADGALVFGIDLPAYLKQMESIDDKCSFPAGHFEEMSDWMQRHQNLKKFSYPYLVGDGDGAAFAYAVDAQAPRGTFAGLITLGYGTTFRLPKPICAGDAGKITAPDANGQFRVIPVNKLPNPWMPLLFAPGARRDGGFATFYTMLKSFLGPLGTDAGVALVQRVAELDARVNAPPALPQDVADLPLIEVPAQGAFANRIAIILTGDGGWAGLDVAVADQLSKRGIAVVGLNTLKFFWQTRQPEQAADALTRIIGHYGAEHAQADFVVIGYSFGAALAPVVINRLPEAARVRFAAQVLISPDPEAVFEVKMGDWFGSAHHEGSIPIAPEIARTKVPVICVYGDEEDDSFCGKIANVANVKMLQLSGGHHYNGDYDKLGASIVASLPSHKSSADPH